MNVRKSLLSGVSLLAINAAVVASVVCCPALAQAQCSTITSGTTTISNAATGCVVWTGGNISITSSGTIAGAATAIEKISGTLGNVTNSGFLDSTLWAFYNVATIATISNLSAGTITGPNDGIYNGGYIASINNSGKIFSNTTTNDNAINNNGTIGVIVNNSGGTLSGGTGISSYGASLGTITNSGLILGSARGISAGSTLSTIVNNAGGTISGAVSGIWNNGHTYGTITNSGLIEGQVAIINQGLAIGTISIISNLSGGIINGTNTAISNLYSSGIGTVSNVGTISAGSIAVSNSSGKITSLTNSIGGVIHGGNTAILDGSIISSLNNSGTISGGIGIRLQGFNDTISTINNSGTITGVGDGIVIQGSNDIIASINNTGTISGGVYAISNRGMMGGGATAILSTGSIIGALFNSGTITGIINVNQAFSIAGTGALAGGSIKTNNNNLFFVAGANQVLSENINVGSGTVTNQGTITLGATESITGSYLQVSTAGLAIKVTNVSNYGELAVSGNAVLTDDDITIQGTLAAGNVFTIAKGSTIGTDYSSINVLESGYLVTVSSVANAGIESLMATISACSNETVTSNKTQTANACGITWTGGYLTIANGIWASGSNTAILSSGSGLGNFSNNGTIIGKNYGIKNSGTIGSFTNNSFISANTNGVLNTGIISTLSNSGTIEGVTSGHGVGIKNSGTIGSLVNTNFISGFTSGISNRGVISILSNSGTIGGIFGINNDGGGTIASIINNGTIGVGNGHAILNVDYINSR